MATSEQDSICQDRGSLASHSSSRTVGVRERTKKERQFLCSFLEAKNGGKACQAEEKKQTEDNSKTMPPVLLARPVHVTVLPWIPSRMLHIYKIAVLKFERRH